MLKRTTRFFAERPRSLDNPPGASGKVAGVSGGKSSFVFAQHYNPEYKKRIESQNMIKNEKEFRFAIVGSGPAGFYMAKNLLKFVPNIRVDVYDRNPHPFGLIRTGVAPDHQAMKRIENDFTTVLNEPGCEFFGNVWVGDKEEAARQGCAHTTVEELRQKYSGVVLAYGAISDRKLGLPGEDHLHGVLPSRRVVDWYNGSLDFDLGEDEFDLRAIERLAIVGNGNIATDMSRVLLRPPEDLDSSDAPTGVINQLKSSNLHTIEMVGRRGITQAAFTTKEIKELCNLPNLTTYMLRDEVEASMTEASRVELLLRGIGRRTDFLNAKALAIETPEQYMDVVHDKSHRKLILRFLRNPEELYQKNGRLGGIKLQKMRLDGEAEHQKAVPDASEDFEEYQTLRCDALIKSIGYKTLPMPGVPYDDKKFVIPQTFGCVHKPGSDEMDIGLYCAGWAKRGPVGIIDATLRDSMDTFRVIKHHLECDVLQEKTHTVSEAAEGLKCVNMAGWTKVRDHEIAEGAKLNKLKEKVLDKETMVKLAGL